MSFGLNQRASGVNFSDSGRVFMKVEAGAKRFDSCACAKAGAWGPVTKHLYSFAISPCHMNEEIALMRLGFRAGKQEHGKSFSSAGDQTRHRLRRMEAVIEQLKAGTRNSTESWHKRKLILEKVPIRGQRRGQGRLQFRVKR